MKCFQPTRLFQLRSDDTERYITLSRDARWLWLVERSIKWLLPGAMLGPNGGAVCPTAAINSASGHLSHGLPQAWPTDAQHSALVMSVWTDPSQRPSTIDTQHELRLVSTSPTDRRTDTHRQTDVTRVTSVVDTSLIAILKLHSNGPSYSAIQWLVHWPLIGGLLHLVQRGRDWASYGPAQAPPRCTKCNSPPINGQCTNFV